MPKIDVSRVFKGVDKKWISVFTSSTLMPCLKKALSALEKEDNIGDITPHPYEMFNFARNTAYGTIVAVIVGQDPYPKKGDADGMCFSSKSAVIPASLKNIYKCLEYNGEIKALPSTADLSNWARQGVLMINTSLTTRVGTANAHKSIWKDFTDALIQFISNDESCGPGFSLTFMLWGNFAIGKKSLVNDDCVVYEWAHPSPLAQGVKDEKKKFLYCDHFTKLNLHLENEQGLPPIRWDPSRCHIAYTDGSCTGNGKGILACAGYACYFSHGLYASTIKYGKIAPVVIGKDMVYGTNQRGEGLGIITALETVLESDTSPNLIIITDSMFWIEMINDYMPKWDMRGTKFESKKNSDITIRMWKLVEQINKNGSLELIHVASHDKDSTAPVEHVVGNRIADKYAGLARNLMTYEQVVERI